MSADSEETKDNNVLRTSFSELTLLKICETVTGESKDGQLVHFMSCKQEICSHPCYT